MSATITSIRVQKKNPRRANLYLDGHFALGLSIEVVADFGLRQGQALSEQELEALREAEGRHRAYEDALRLLSHRARSRAELRQRLARKGYEQGQVERVLTRLQEQRFLDDWEHRSVEPDEQRLRRRAFYLSIVRRLARLI